MNPCRSIAPCDLAVISLAFIPARASAQAGRGGGMGGMGTMMQIRTVMAQLDLNDDQKAKIQDIMKQAMEDARDKMQGLQDATQEERQSKMQDLQKLATDTREKGGSRTDGRSKGKILHADGAGGAEADERSAGRAEDGGREAGDF